MSALSSVLFSKANTSSVSLVTEPAADSANTARGIIENTSISDKNILGILFIVLILSLKVVLFITITRGYCILILNNKEDGT